VLWYHRRAARAARRGRSLGLTTNISWPYQTGDSEGPILIPRRRSRAPIRYVQQRFATAVCATPRARFPKRIISVTTDTVASRRVTAVSRNNYIARTRRSTAFDDSVTIPPVSRRWARAFHGTALALAVVPAEFDWGVFVAGSSLGERTALFSHSAGSVERDIATAVPPGIFSNEARSRYAAPRRVSFSPNFA